MRPETKLLEKPIRTGKIPQEANENAKKIQGNYLWRGKPAMITSRLVLVLHLIGREGGPSFEHRSQSDLKQKYRNSGSSQK